MSVAVALNNIYNSIEIDIDNIYSRNPRDNRSRASITAVIASVSPPQVALHTYKSK